MENNREPSGIDEMIGSLSHVHDTLHRKMEAIAKQRTIDILTGMAVIRPTADDGPCKTSGRLLVLRCSRMLPEVG